LLLQVELFEKFQLEDEFEGKGEYDLDNLNDAFQAICMRNQFSVKNSEQLLEILKLLFHIEEPNQENKWVQATDVLRKIVFFQGIKLLNGSSKDYLMGILWITPQKAFNFEPL